MRAADGYQTYILGSAAAYTLAAQSSSGPTTYDGTAWVAEFMDDYLFGPVNALFYATNQTYAETAESYTASDWLTALGKYICRVAFTEKPYVNLVIKNNASTPNSKVDIDCTSIYVGWKKHETVDLTLDITASGALGLDTGTEASDKWYYIWLLSKLDGTLTGVLSESATAPTLPTGYIFSKLVGEIYNESTGHLRAQEQLNDTIRYTNIGSGTWESNVNGSASYVQVTAANIAKTIPPTLADIKDIDLYFFVDNATQTIGIAYLTGAPSLTKLVASIAHAHTAYQHAKTVVKIPPLPAYYYVSSATTNGGIYMFVLGYRRNM